MKSETICPYCGNTSGLLDSRGNCISCGGQIPQAKKAEERHRDIDFRTGTQIYVDPFEACAPEVQVGIPYIATYFGYPLGVYAIGEIRKMVGLDGEN